MIKKLLIIVLTLFIFTGCVNLNDMSYDEIINEITKEDVKANNYRKGYSLYIPKGLAILDAGVNYLILSSDTVNYYLYLDFINYKEGKKIEYQKDDSYYFKEINNDGFLGYVNIKLWKNNQYLIEIMYNYAKIEVMVDKDLINNVLINSINILKSIRYNDDIIEKILKSDSLDNTEEIFDIFKDVTSSSSTLEHENDKEEANINMDIKDTDYIN